MLGDHMVGLRTCVCEDTICEETFYDVTTRNPIPYTLNPAPYTLHLAPYTLHPEPQKLHPTPRTLHHTPKTQNPTIYTLHPTTYTLRPTTPTPHPHRCEENLRAMVNACDAETVTSSVGTLLCPYGIAYRRAYESSTNGSFKQ